MATAVNAGDCTFLRIYRKMPNPQVTEPMECLWSLKTPPVPQQQPQNAGVAVYTRQGVILKLIISPLIAKKLAEKHGGIRDVEIRQAFLNRTGPILQDDREEHASDPPTLWFCAMTDKGRMLKIVYINKDGVIFLKTAYEPGPPTVALYRLKCLQAR